MVCGQVASGLACPPPVRCSLPRRPAHTLASPVSSPVGTERRTPRATAQQPPATLRATGRRACRQGCTRAPVTRSAKRFTDSGVPATTSISTHTRFVSTARASSSVCGDTELAPGATRRARVTWGRAAKSLPFTRVIRRRTARPPAVTSCTCHWIAHTHAHWPSLAWWCGPGGLLDVSSLSSQSKPQRNNWGALDSRRPRTTPMPCSKTMHMITMSWYGQGLRRLGTCKDSSGGTQWRTPSTHLTKPLQHAQHPGRHHPKPVSVQLVVHGIHHTGNFVQCSLLLQWAVQNLAHGGHEAAEGGKAPRCKWRQAHSWGGFSCRAVATSSGRLRLNMDTHDTHDSRFQEHMMTRSGGWRRACAASLLRARQASFHPTISCGQAGILICACFFPGLFFMHAWCK
jgi:hypothetical protein